MSPGVRSIRSGHPPNEETGRRRSVVHMPATTTAVSDGGGGIGRSGPREGFCTEAYYAGSLGWGNEVDYPVTLPARHANEEAKHPVSGCRKQGCRGPSSASWKLER